MGAYETKEELTPDTPNSSQFTSYANVFALSEDPRSPDVSRTPILVQDPRYDPRSPAAGDVDRTPVFSIPEEASPFVKLVYFKLFHFSLLFYSSEYLPR